MDEYISREETVKKIEEKLKVDDLMSLAEEVWTNNCLEIVLRAIMAVETADVQPVNRWISVEDRLPEPEKDVLIWYRHTWGAGFTSYRFGISRWFPYRKRWYEGCLPKDIEVLYWQPLPEPPKDGDSNG